MWLSAVSAFTVSRIPGILVFNNLIKSLMVVGKFLIVFLQLIVAEVVANEILNAAEYKIYLTVAANEEDQIRFLYTRTRLFLLAKSIFTLYEHCAVKYLKNCKLLYMRLI